MPDQDPQINSPADKGTITRYTPYIIPLLIGIILFLLFSKQIPKEAYYLIGIGVVAYVGYHLLRQQLEPDLPMLRKFILKEAKKFPMMFPLDTSLENMYMLRRGNEYYLGMQNNNMIFTIVQTGFGNLRIIELVRGSIDWLYDLKSRETSDEVMLRHGYAPNNITQVSKENQLQMLR